MGENVDGGRKRKIYMRDTLPLSNIKKKKKTLTPLALERQRVSPMSTFTAVYIFAHCMIPPCLYALRL